MLYPLHTHNRIDYILVAVVGKMIMSQFHIVGKFYILDSQIVVFLSPGSLMSRIIFPYELLLGVTPVSS